MGFVRTGQPATVASLNRATPPGPRGLSFWWYLLRAPNGWLDLLPWLVRRYGDIVGFGFFGSPACVINSPAGIEYVLVTDYQNFTKSMDYRALSRVLGQGLLTSEGEFWKHQRRLVQPAFFRDRILSYGSLMTSYTRRMLETWRDGEVRDVHADMMRVTLEIAARSLFNVDITHAAGTIGRAVDVVLQEMPKLAGFAFLPDWVPVPGLGGFRRALADLDRIVYGIIRERRTNGERPGDLLDMLLDARDDDGTGMSDRQLRDEVMTLLLAGHETTANTLAWTLYLLARHPEQQSRLAAEVREVLGGATAQAAELQSLPFTQRVLTESQRLYPPAWAIGRKAIHDFEVGGYHLRAGTNVVISQWVLHRDPRFFPDPERFDPDRWRENNLPKFAYLPFGAGPRVCVGASLALTESALVLATLMQRFQFSLAAPDPVRAFPSVTLRPRHGLRLRVEKRV
ncbi:MAG TPA: cytochrome P450 [Bryobacteraceae bacterium]|nr:cytochrome P450 [Bryobacteraceae bacterium]